MLTKLPLRACVARSKFPEQSKGFAALLKGNLQIETTCLLYVPGAGRGAVNKNMKTVRIVRTQSHVCSVQHVQPVVRRQAPAHQLGAFDLWLAMVSLPPS